jgi:C-terminal processing protease CtpA/Prc
MSHADQNPSKFASIVAVAGSLFMLVLSLCLPCAALADQSKSLLEQAKEAEVGRDYLRSGQLYLAAAEHGDQVELALYNAACGFALAGRSDEAFQALERAFVAGDSFLEHAKTDTDLVSLHGDARWHPLLDRAAKSAKAYQEFWNGPSMQTPFKENLSDDEKVAGLSKLWAEAKFNFIHFDKVPALNWDATYMEYLPKVRATTSTFEYYLVLMEMYARLGDGHTGVWMPRELMEERARPPLLRTQLVEGKVMIVGIAEQLAVTGLTAGLEIVEIDGSPAIDYATRNVMPYQGGSTPQDRTMRVYGRALLLGPKNQSVALTVRDAAGEVSVRNVARASNTDYWKTFDEEPMVFKMLPGNVAYVALNSFNDDQAADRFEAAFAEIAKADALVIDVRENGGGNGEVGYRVLTFLADNAFYTSKWETRNYQPVFRAWGKRETRFSGTADKISPNGKQRFAKPVVVLTSPRTYSAAEDFTGAFRAMKRGKVVGEVTGGSSGMPLLFPLPGGGGAYVCTKHDALADGTEFVGVGIIPDVVVSPTVADLRAHRDVVLDAALQQIAKK